MRHAATFVIGFGALLLSACGDAAVGAEAPSPPGPAPVAPVDPVDRAPPDGAAPPADPPSPPATSCARAEVAKTAPVALYDAFTVEIATLSGAARTARVEKLLADVAAAGGAPLEDEASGRVVFLASEAPPSGAFNAVGSFGDWKPENGVALAPIAGTDLWSGEATIARGTTFEYKLASGDTFREDPLASHVVWDGIQRGFGVRGEFNAVGHPGAAPMRRGRTIALGKVHATKLADDREVWVHYPAAYDDSACKKLPSIVFHDGLESLTRGGFAEEADALYAKRPDLAAVLVFVGLPTQDVRMEQYTMASPGAKGASYVDFLANDLWPRVAKGARVCGKPAARGISGASLGGLISTYGAFERADQWGWVGAQSGSFFWADGAMITRASTEPKKPLRIYLDSGCPADNCDVTDQLAAALKNKGYDYVRIKKDGAEHDWAFWRDRLAGMLTHFRDAQTACD